MFLQICLGEDDFLVDLENSKMLQNAYLDAKIGVDPAENEPRKELWVVDGSTLLARPSASWRTSSTTRTRPLVALLRRWPAPDAGPARFDSDGQQRRRVLAATSSAATSLPEGSRIKFGIPENQWYEFFFRLLKKKN